jgi:protein-S-isoprenylcysteine O-methyltransferase Ste14
VAIFLYTGELDYYPVGCLLSLAVNDQKKQSITNSKPQTANGASPHTKTLCRFVYFMITQYLILVAGWVAYFAIHSGLASPAIKQRYHFRGYRVVYVIISVAGFLALLLYNGSIAAEHFFVSSGPPRYVSLMLTTFGVMIIQSSFRQYTFMGFVGVKEEKSGLRTDGILKHVRHPIYSGTILVIIGFFLFIPNLPTLVSCICMLAYLPIGILLEERKLIATYGDAYREYRSRVPALIPRF